MLLCFCQTGDDVAEDEQINEMMMRTEDEFELFQRLDRERKAREAADWAERKVRRHSSPCACAAAAALP